MSPHLFKSFAMVPVCSRAASTPFVLRPLTVKKGPQKIAVSTENEGRDWSNSFVPRYLLWSDHDPTIRMALDAADWAISIDSQRPRRLPPSRSCGETPSNPDLSLGLRWSGVSDGSGFGF